MVGGHVYIFYITYIRGNDMLQPCRNSQTVGTLIEISLLLSKKASLCLTHIGGGGEEVNERP